MAIDLPDDPRAADWSAIQGIVAKFQTQIEALMQDGSLSEEDGSSALALIGAITADGWEVQTDKAGTAVHMIHKYSDKPYFGSVTYGVADGPKVVFEDVVAAFLDNELRKKYDTGFISADITDDQTNEAGVRMFNMHALFKPPVKLISARDASLRVGCLPRTEDGVLSFYYSIPGPDPAKGYVRCEIDHSGAIAVPLDEHKVLVIRSEYLNPCGNINKTLMSLAKQRYDRSAEDFRKLFM